MVSLKRSGLSNWLNYDARPYWSQFPVLWMDLCVRHESNVHHFCHFFHDIYIYTINKIKILSEQWFKEHMAKITNQSVSSAASFSCCSFWGIHFFRCWNKCSARLWSSDWLLVQSITLTFSLKSFFVELAVCFRSVYCCTMAHLSIYFDAYLSHTVKHQFLHSAYRWACVVWTMSRYFPSPHFGPFISLGVVYLVLTRKHCSRPFLTHVCYVL